MEDSQQRIEFAPPTQPLETPSQQQQQLAQPYQLLETPSQQQQQQQQDTDGQQAGLLTRKQLELDTYLPEDNARAYRELSGYDKDQLLYEWQAWALQAGSSGQNFIFSAPTSAGKTAVYDILALRRLINLHKPFVLVFPTVVLCEQRAAFWEKLLSSKHICRKVKRYFGGVNSPGLLIEDDTGCLICTIEKANSLILQVLMTEKNLESLSTLVIDELHMLADENRGYLLELLLTKLLYSNVTCAASKDTSQHQSSLSSTQDSQQDFSKYGVQVIGMSASLPNTEEIADWLGAKHFTTKFRPVPLVHYILDCPHSRDESGARNLLDHQLKVQRTLTYPDPSWKKSDPLMVNLLAQETISAGHSVLIFCNSRAACEAVASSLQRHLGGLPEKNHQPAPFLEESERDNPPGSRVAMVEELMAIQGTNVGTHSALECLMSAGIAFHHAGLTREERQLVEAAFLSGAISALCCTATLAQGVNMPARRVIFYKPFLPSQNEPLGVAQYHQMAGRAGRAGIDEAGESILIVYNRNNPRYSSTALAKLINSKPDPITSCLVLEKRGMKRAIVEAITTETMKRDVDIQKFVQSTLLRYSVGGWEAAVLATRTAIQALCDERSIYWDRDVWRPTTFGKATCISGMDPQDALLVRNDLCKASKALVLPHVSELYMIFLCVPPRFHDYEVNWKKLHAILLYDMTGIERQIINYIGIKEGYVHWRANRMGSRDRSEQERLGRKLFVALLLNDYVQEVALPEIKSKFDIEKATIYNLQSTCAKTAGMVTKFCKEMSWDALAFMTNMFQARLNYGIKSELTELTRIPGLRGHRARLLFKAGMKTPDDVAAKTVSELAKDLASSRPDKLPSRRDFKAAEAIHKSAMEFREQLVAQMEGDLKKLREGPKSQAKPARPSQDAADMLGHLDEHPVEPEADDGQHPE